MKKNLQLLLLVAAMLLPWTTKAQLSCDDGMSSCALTVEMHDSYGDGWNGGTLTVMQGSTVRATLTLNGGNAGEAEVPVCSGEISFQWSSGNYDDEVSFTIYNADGTVMASISDASMLGGTFHTDTVVCPTCPRPRGLVASNVTNSSALITWSESSIATSWVVEYANGMFTPGSGDATVEYLTDTTLSLTGLSGNTAYYVYVRALCSDDDSSAWTMLSFRTACGTELQTLPYYENFDQHSILQAPACWEVSTIANYSDYGSPVVYPNQGRNGSNALFFNDISFGSAIETRCGTPFFGNPASLQAQYYAKYSPSMASAPDLFVVGLMDGAGTFVPYDTVALTPNYEPHTVYFDGCTLDSARLAFRVYMAGNFYNGFAAFVDDITVMEAPDCRQPLNFASTGNTPTSVTLAWDANQADTWEVAYGPTGIALTDAAVEYEYNISDTYVTIEDLSDTGSYDFYVRAVCGSGDYSAWAGPINVLPGLVLMGSTDTAMGCNFTVADDGGLNGSYSPNMFQTLVLLPSQEDSTLHLSGTVITPNITSEKLTIYEGIGTDGRVLGVFGGPSGAETMVNVTSSVGAITLTFLSDYYASYYPEQCIGFELHASCEVRPDCNPVYDLSVSDISGTTARLAWLCSSEVADYTVTVTDTASQVSVQHTANTNSFLIPSLSELTTYEVSVTVNCTNGSASPAASLTFTTGCLAGGELTYGTNSQATNYLPFNAYYNYAASQQIIPTDQLPSVGDTLFGISLWNNGANTANRNITIFVDTTSLPNLNGHNFIPQDSAHIVYSAATAVTAGPDWIYIPFSTPFAYPGEGNLLITFDDNTGSYATPYPYFGVNNTNDTMSLTFQSDGTNPDVFTASNFTPTPRKYNSHLKLHMNCMEVNCVAPHVAATAGSTSIDVEWAPGYTETTWSVEHKLHSDAQWTMDVVATTSTNYTISGLMANNQYDVRVTSLCGDDNASATVMVTTVCEAIASLPFLEDFEGFTASSELGTNIQSCWHRIDNSDYGEYPYATNYEAFSGSSSVFFTYAYVPYLVLPLFETSIDSLVVQAKVFNANAGSTASVRVGVLTDPTNAGTFTSVGTVNVVSNGTDWEDIEVSLENYTGTGRYIAISVGSGNTTFYLDDLRVVRANPCGRVSNPTVDSTTLTEAYLSWTDPANVGDYTICWGYANDVNAAIDSMTVTSTSCTLSSLTHSTSYYAWVRTNCTDAQGWWTAFGQFSTPCGEIVAVPWSEDFENTLVGYLPTCWTASETMYGYPYVDDYLTYQSNRALNFGADNYMGGISRNVVAMPAIASLGGLQLSFFMRAYSTDYMPTLTVAGLLDANNNFIPVDTLTVSTTWAPVTIYLDNYTNRGSNRIAFLMEQSIVGSANIAIDNLVLDSAAGCRPVSNVVSPSTTDNSISLTWQENGEATQWMIAYSTSAMSNPSAGTLVPSTATSAVLTGLNPNTDYYVYVRAICGVGDSSPWSDPCIASTLCLTTTSFPIVESFDNVVLPNCWQVEYDASLHEWQFGVSGVSNYSSVLTPQEGTGNAAFLHSTSGSTTTLLSPVMDLTQLTNPYLSFWHVQPVWSGDQDILTLL